MRAGELFGVAGTFAVAVLLVVGATVGAAIVLDDDTSKASQPDAPAFGGAILPEPVSDAGSIEPPETDAQKTVVVDLSHGNGVDRTDFQPLVDSLVSAGHDVRFFTGGSSSLGYAGGSSSSPLNETLRDADALVVANPATAYSGDEVNGIEAFADAGGRVLLLADTPTRETSSSATVIPGLPTGGASAAASGQPTNVAARFGITFGSGYLYDMTDNANNFQYVYGSPSGDDELVADAERTVFRAAVPVVTDDESTTLVEGEDVRLSSTRKNGTYAVAVRDGDVAAVGDTWFLSPEASTLADNEHLVGNVATFLTGGEKASGAPQSSGPSMPSPGSGVSSTGQSVPTPSPTTPEPPSNATPSNETPDTETATET
jgi:hypothetical protein